MKLIDTFDRYRKRAVHEWSTWQHERETSRKRNVVRKWISKLESDPPDVLIGSNFAEFGGVRGHIESIQKFSSLTVSLAPPTKSVLAQGVTPWDLKTRFREMFFDLKPHGISAVHSHVFPWFIEWCREKQVHGTRWIHTYHNMYFPEFARGELEPWQHEINHALLNVASSADVRISVSRWQQRYLKDHHGIETTYVPNGADVEACISANGDRFTLAFGHRDFILYVGRNDTVKNPADFVRLAQQMPTYSFVMIGHDLSDETLQRDWQTSVPNNLRVIGPLSHGETLDAIAASSVLVVTSLREGLPTLVMESMATSTPVVVPNDEGCVEVIDGGNCGFIYRQGDIADLAEVTRNAIRDQRKPQAALQRVQDEYSWTSVITKLDELYREC